MRINKLSLFNLTVEREYRRDSVFRVVFYRRSDNVRHLRISRPKYQFIFPGAE